MCSRSGSPLPFKLETARTVISPGPIRRATAARRLPILTAGFFLAYLIAVSPHLVHHAFEEDHGHQHGHSRQDDNGRPSCPLLLLSQQTHSELQDALSFIAPPVLVSLLASPQGPTVLALLLQPLRQPRAPPRLPVSL